MSQFTQNIAITEARKTALFLTKIHSKTVENLFIRVFSSKLFVTSFPPVYLALKETVVFSVFTQGASIRLDFFSSCYRNSEPADIRYIRQNEPYVFKSAHMFEKNGHLNRYY